MITLWVDAHIIVTKLSINSSFSIFKSNWFLNKTLYRLSKINLPSCLRNFLWIVLLQYYDCCILYLITNFPKLSVTTGGECREVGASGWRNILVCIGLDTPQRQHYDGYHVDAHVSTACVRFRSHLQRQARHCRHSHHQSQVCIASKCAGLVASSLPTLRLHNLSPRWFLNIAIFSETAKKSNTRYKLRTYVHFIIIFLCVAFFYEGTNVINLR